MQGAAVPASSCLFGTDAEEKVLRSSESRLCRVCPHRTAARPADPARRARARASAASPGARASVAGTWRAEVPGPICARSHQDVNLKKRRLIDCPTVTRSKNAPGNLRGSVSPYRQGKTRGGGRARKVPPALTRCARARATGPAAAAARGARLAGSGAASAGGRASSRARAASLRR